jgi:ubiquinone/menaquinone biosynthesis C-methylase UbiE
MLRLYNKYLLPKITNKVCASGPTMKQRAKIVPLASGKVLEVGAGSGLNFAFYDPAQVEQVIALEPSKEMWALAEERRVESPLEIVFLLGGAEAIPLEDNTVDCIVTTYTMCTIPDITAAFSEFRRVLKPNGRLLFCEHGKAPETHVRRWQNRLNPAWKVVGGGCNLNRDIPQLIKDGTFVIDQLETMYIPGPKLASFNYWGVAKPL